jgi:hypothetical protein
MKAGMTLAAGTLGLLLSSSAFAEDGTSLTADAPRMRVQAQLEMLPLGSTKASVAGASESTDLALAYGVTGAFDYAVMPYLSIGVAPRLVLDVNEKDGPESGSSDTQVDLRARIVGHIPVARGLEVYAALTPGYTLVLSGTEGVPDANGFAIGGAAGLTYDVSPRLFVSGEVGYQRAFTSAEIMPTAGTSVEADLDVSYMHVGLGAGTRF